MAEMLEVRWHGRGGQGAKTAAILLADAAASAGKYVQAFPEYGPERMGAPVVSYNRISNEPILLHSSVANPQYVAVLDPTFLGTMDVTAGVPDGGAIIVNTSRPREQITKQLKIGDRDIRVYTVDASKISEEEIGRPIPNTPMLGALVGVLQVLTLDELLAEMENKLKRKFRNKPEVIEGNLQAIKRAYQEVANQ